MKKYLIKAMFLGFFICPTLSFADDPCAQIPASGTLKGNFIVNTVSYGSCTWDYNPSVAHQGAVIDINGSISNGHSNIPGVKCADSSSIEIVGTCNNGVLALHDQNAGIDMSGYTINGVLTASGQRADGGTINFHLSVPSTK